MANNFYKYILYFLGGVLFLGALLDAISNTISLITPKITYWGTGIIALLWLIIELWAKKKGIIWTLPRGDKVTIRRFNSKVRLFIGGLILTLWIPIIFPSNNTPEALIITEDSTFNPNDSTSNLKILLLPFKPDINCTELDVDYQAQLLERLTKKKEIENLSIKILKPDDIDDCPLSDEEAREMGLKKYADIVIWGNYEENIKGVEGLRIRYTIVKDFDIDPIKRTGDTEMQPLDNLYQLRQGYLQKDIDYVIYWIEGINAFRLGDFKQAISRFNEIIKITNNDTISVDPYMRLGQLYYEFVRGKESLFNFKKALSIQETVLYSPPAVLAKTYSNISSAYRLIHQSDSAIQYGLKALTIQEVALDSLHPDLARTYFNIGNAYIIQSQSDSALQYFQKALTIQKVALDPLHPDLARTYMNIGNTYILQSQNDSVIQYFQKALTIQEVALDPLHPDLARTYFNIGNLYLYKGQNSSALPYYQKALTIQEVALDSLHPDLARTYVNIGVAYFNKGQNNSAIQYFQKALAKQEVALGSLHPDLARTYANIGVAYFNKGQNDSAIQYFQKALTIQEVTLDSLHPDLALTYMNIGEVNVKIGKYIQALKYLKKSKNIVRIKLGDSHIYIAYLEYKNTKYYKSLNQYENALRSIKKSIAVLSTHYPENHKEIVNAKELKKEIEDAIEISRKH